MALHNNSSHAESIEYGDRIAQLVIQPYLDFELEEAAELDETERGDGGFGHTGA